jgi:hypothetical protein
LAFIWLIKTKIEIENLERMAYFFKEMKVDVGQLVSQRRFNSAPPHSPPPSTALDTIFYVPEACLTTFHIAVDF